MKAKAIKYLLIAAFAAPAFGGITYVCNTTSADDPDTYAAGTCNYLNSTIAGLYSSAFTNANATIYIQMGITGLGSSTSGYYNFVSYSSYAAALAAEDGAGTVRADALAALSSIDASSSYDSDSVWVTSALGTALGLPNMVGTTAGGAACFTGTSGCYNGIITITTPANLSSETGGTQGLYWDQNGGSQPGNDYDFYSVVEHETDEVLGTASCMDTQGATLTDPCDAASGATAGTGTPSAVDLYRYNSSGHLAFNSNCIGVGLTATVNCPAGAYFSYNGGATNGNPNGNAYNELANGNDYADFDAYTCGVGPYNVQDGTGCPGSHPWINSDGGAEINILDAVGFNIQNPTPEPATVGLIGASLIGLGVIRYRRRKN